MSTITVVVLPTGPGQHTERAGRGLTQARFPWLFDEGGAVLLARRHLLPGSASAGLEHQPVGQMGDLAKADSPRQVREGL